MYHAHLQIVNCPANSSSKFQIVTVKLILQANLQNLQPANLAMQLSN